MKETDTSKIPSKMNPKRPIPRHTIIKMPNVKDKERILKAGRETQLVTYRGVPIRVSGDFPKEILQSRRARNSQSHGKWGPTAKIVLPAKKSFRIEGQIRSFPDKKKLREFIITKSLHEMLKGLI